MKRIVLSTDNKNKVREIKSILKDLSFEVISKSEAGLSDIEVEETESTLSGNALLKAKAISEKTKGIVLADDTGLFVEALDGEPGVYSARYAGEDGNDKKNREKLLEKLKNSKNRKAKFVTSIAIVFEGGNTEIIEGECRGVITEAEIGTNGFGYDSIFVPEDYEETFAELGNEVKNRISHRAKALEKLKERLESVED
jgi:XTP/dITP diphosphohydrolase